ncbi:hypothetical protein [Nocardia wallacei]|uniref:hypothetical protein n=1 Tax=Nocardia wallacei TaxID=480035 RepID=UPI002454CB66|nr:hypothetical protein [Nocardia wallacei]
MFGIRPTWTQTPLAQGEIGTVNLLGWLNGNVVTVLVLVAGMVMLIASLKAHMSRVISVGSCAVIALAFVALGNNAGMQSDIGSWLWGLFHN